MHRGNGTHKQRSRGAEEQRSRGAEERIRRQRGRTCPPTVYSCVPIVGGALLGCGLCPHQETGLRAAAARRWWWAAAARAEPPA